MRNSEEGTAVRQNSEYKTSRKHEANLRRNPTLHFQIGLILALVAAIFFIEMRMPETAVVIPDREIDTEDVFYMGPISREQKKVIVPEKKKAPPAKKQSVIIEKVKAKNDDADLVETLLESTDPDTNKPMVDPGAVATAEEPEEPATVPFEVIEQVPLFPGCEGLDTNEERRNCMSNQMRKFVSKKFKTRKGEGLGLEGENQIYVIFKIDKEGNVTDVRARAPHKKLEEEAIRVTQLLPKMTPGQQRGNNVNVTMALPIKFIIE